MSFNDFMNKIRHVDNITAKWLLRHFYFTFFQAVLLCVFVFWFMGLFSVINISDQLNPKDISTRLIFNQSVNSSIMVFLLLLNSFWILFIFNGMQRILNLLKELNYNLTRFRNTGKPNDSSAQN